VTHRPTWATAVRQAYGWIFSAPGCVVIWREGEEVGLPGGRPEPFDADIEATCGGRSGRSSPPRCSNGKSVLR
jgi:hypothetical protein